MENPIIQRGSKLRDVVARLQLALQGVGFSVRIDGAFGRATEKAVIELQERQGIETDGIVGPATWQTLEDLGGQSDESQAESSEPLPGFRGDLSWIHGWQGHAGGPYWPGGAVGVTLDPGIDLGHVSLEVVTQAYRPRLDEDAWQVVEKLVGVRGEAAQEALRNNSVLRRIAIDRHTAGEIFPHAADPIWRALLRRFPSLGREETPAAVQTALLSLATDHGAAANSFKTLRPLIADRDWHGLATAVQAMDEHHRLERTLKRRRAEAALIRQAVH